ncbi:12471_t:CDS:2, partial [Racocetra fulgida]
EIEVTDLLVQELTAQGTFESEEESKRREVVLGKLDKLVKEFVYNISREKKKLPEADAREAGGKIFTFGSYRLGVHGAENLALAHPFVKGFDKIYHCTSDQMATDVMHGIFDSTSTSDKNSTELSQNGTEPATVRDIYTTTFYVGLDINPRDRSHDSVISSSELPPEVFEDGQKKREDFSKKRKRVGLTEKKLKTSGQKVASNDRMSNISSNLCS